MGSDISNDDMEKAVAILSQLDGKKISQVCHAAIAHSLAADKKVADNLRTTVKQLSEMAASPDTGPQLKMSLARAVVELLQIGAESAERFAKLAEMDDEEEDGIIDATNADEFLT